MGRPILDEEELYRGLLAGILRQAIVDYVVSKRTLIRRQGGKITNLRHSGYIKSVEEFFSDPPYDYGDIDFAYLKRLCDEKAEEGTKIDYLDHAEINRRRAQKRYANRHFACPGN